MFSRKIAADIPWGARVGLIMVATYVFICLVAPWLAPHGEAELVGSPYEPWSNMFPLGTDALGRDMLSRLIYGARNSIGVALVITFLAFLIGGGAGLVAASGGRWLDQIVSRTVDILMAIPMLIFALLILTVTGTSTLILIFVAAILEATRVYRVARAVGMDVSIMEFVDIAKLRGESIISVIWREILPNTFLPLVAEFGVRFCFVFLFISTLSFLGLGIQPPTADWGRMVRENADLIAFGGITPLLPAAALAGLAISVNLVVDWILRKSNGCRR